MNVETARRLTKSAIVALHTYVSILNKDIEASRGAPDGGLVKITLNPLEVAGVVIDPTTDFSVYDFNDLYEILTLRMEDYTFYTTEYRRLTPVYTMADGGIICAGLRDPQRHFKTAMKYIEQHFKAERSSMAAELANLREQLANEVIRFRTVAEQLEAQQIRADSDIKLIGGAVGRLINRAGAAKTTQYDTYKSKDVPSGVARRYTRTTDYSRDTRRVVDLRDGHH